MSMEERVDPGNDDGLALGVGQALDALASMPADALGELASAIETTRPRSRAELGSLLRRLDPSMGAEAASATVAFLLAAGSRDWAQFPDDRRAFIQELLTARGDDVEARPQLASVLDAVLVAKPLRLSAKASALQLEHEHVLYGAQVISDVRPLFLDTEGALALEGSVVNHMLRLEYGANDGSPRSLFLAMDEEDLRRLGEVIERALHKAALIEEHASKSDLAIYKPWQSDEVEA